MIRRVHLVYPHGRASSCPDTIGLHLADHLRTRYEVVLHDWDAGHAIAPSPGDALVGHPHPVPWTTFRRSARRRGWERVAVLMPFHHAERAEQVAFADPAVRRADVLLAITGHRWSDTIATSAVAHWTPKLVQLDLGVDRGDFPPVKHDVGARRVLYIGHSHWTKNTAYLTEIAARLPDVEFGWIGSGPSIHGLVAHGRRDFADPAALELVASYDFTITVSRADANPCTVLESMAWGLVPFCTPESGYVEEDGVVHVPLDDAAAAAAVVRSWVDAPAEAVQRRRRENWQRLDTRFTWSRFGERVAATLEAPPRRSATTDGRGRLLVRSLTSRHSPLRPHNLRAAAHIVRRSWLP